MPALFWKNLPERTRPFTWSTPAKNWDGTTPEPWRVAHREEALTWLKHLFPDIRDIYVDYEANGWHGRLQIWVGLRDNRDPQDHSARLQGMLNQLGVMGAPVHINTRGGRLNGFWLVDDEVKDGASAARVATLHLVADALGQVKECVAKAYTASWGEPISPRTLHDAVVLPETTARKHDAGIEGSRAVIWTEFAGLSQYDNDVFWKTLQAQLKRHGLYYEWVDGGSASIWPL